MGGWVSKILMLTIAYGGYGWWVGNIQMLMEAFTMVEDGVMFDFDHS